MFVGGTGLTEMSVMKTYQTYRSVGYLYRKNTRVLYGAVFPIGSVRFGAVNRTAPHRRIFASWKTAPHRTAP